MCAALSRDSELQRIIDIARSPGWSLGHGRGQQIMATFDTGNVGLPIVVTVERNRGAMRVSLYQPGDDVNAEGVIVGELRGNPREMGRQLRSLLEDASTPS